MNIFLGAGMRAKNLTGAVESLLAHDDETVRFLDEVLGFELNWSLLL